MKAILLPELFIAPIQHTVLIAILGYALDDRHRVELDVADPLVAAWFATQSSGVQEEVRLALELSTQAETLEPSGTTIQIARTHPTDFTAAPPRLNINDARRILESSFVLLLEDERSDRAFLKRMLTEQERRFLQTRIDNGFVRVDHGGGITSMTRRIARDSAIPMNRHLLWVLFDSDAMRPATPSAQSEAARIACGPVPHHQLRRRYVESYLTHQALHGWAASEPRRPVREERLRRFRAFARMADDQRHHYNMKNGFEGDAARTDASAGTLFDGISAEDRVSLAHGFGGDIAELFDGESVTETDLRRDSSWTELRPVVLDLLARMR